MAMWEFDGTLPSTRKLRRTPSRLVGLLDSQMAARGTAEVFVDSPIALPGGGGRQVEAPGGGGRILNVPGGGGRIVNLPGGGGRVVRLPGGGG
jgi:hypothetical protein